MADDNAPTGGYYADISSASELRRHLNEFYPAARVGPATRVGFIVRGDVSAAEYRRILDTVYTENLSRNQQHFIANPRIPPFDPLPSIIIRSADEMHQAIERLGNNFCYRLPDQIPGHVAGAVAALAAQYNVLKDTWSAFN